MRTGMGRAHHQIGRTLGGAWGALETCCHYVPSLAMGSCDVGVFEIDADGSGMSLAVPLWARAVGMRRDTVDDWPEVRSQHVRA